MSYRWKKQLEAVQLPGDLPATPVEHLNAKKGDWLVFEDGKYIGFFNDKQWRDQAEIVKPPWKRRVSMPGNEKKPPRGRPRGMGKSPLPRNLHATLETLADQSNPEG